LLPSPVDERREVRSWIKSFGYGAREHRLRNDWKNTASGLLLHAATFGPIARRPSLATGDGIVYYAAGWQLLFAAGTVTSYAYLFEAEGETPWPWRVNVQLDEEYTHEFIADGVPLDVLNVDGRIFGNLMKRRSHMALRPGEYQAALDALRH
jgi:hypothetical protein